MAGCSSLGESRRTGYKRMMLSLKDVPVNCEVRIMDIRGRARMRLYRYGLRIGDTVKVLRAAPLGGPLLLAVNSREMAIGRGIAEKILVEIQ